MRRTILGAIAGGALLSLTAAAPAEAAVFGPMSQPVDAKSGNSLVEDVRWRRRRHRRGVGIAAGLITLGVIGAIAANRAHSRPYYRDSYRGQCRRWRRWCRRGNDRACWKFDSRC